MSFLNSNDHQRSTSWYFVGSKTSGQNFWKMLNHLPNKLEMCKWVLKMLPKFKMAATGQHHIFLWARKLKNLEDINYLNFLITFLMIWRCAVDIFKVLLKFQLAAMDQLHFYRAKTWSQKLFNFYNHIPHDMELFSIGRNGSITFLWGKKLESEIIQFLAPAVTVGETEGAMDSPSVFFCLFFCL